MSKWSLPSFRRSVLWSAFLFSWGTSIISASEISLAWNPNKEPDLAGYRVVYGTHSGIYTDQIDAGNKTSVTIDNLVSGTTYYFAVTAYNTAGVGSGFSSEIVYTIPQTSGSNPAPAKMFLNVSTRVKVTGGDGVLIGGFIVTGDKPKSVVLRALGPSLAAAGVKGALSDPILDLYDSSGKLLKENNNWNSADLPDPSLAPTATAEALIDMTLAPGSYTAVVRGAANSSGIALVELYDLNPQNSRVSNISTRGEVGADDAAMIGGFIIGGIESTKVIVRALGPSLGAAGVADSLQDPTLELHNSDGSLLFSNDNWQSNQKQQIIDSTIPPVDSREAAVVATLQPGNYTAVVRGANNSTGVALVEVYALTGP